MKLTDYFTVAKIASAPELTCLRLGNGKGKSGVYPVTGDDFDKLIDLFVVLDASNLTIPGFEDLGPFLLDNKEAVGYFGNTLDEAVSHAYDDDPYYAVYSIAHEKGDEYEDCFRGISTPFMGPDGNLTPEGEAILEAKGTLTVSRNVTYGRFVAYRIGELTFAEIIEGGLRNTKDYNPDEEDL